MKDAEIKKLKEAGEIDAIHTALCSKIWEAKLCLDQAIEFPNLFSFWEKTNKAASLMRDACALWRELPDDEDEESESGSELEQPI